MEPVAADAATLPGATIASVTPSDTAPDAALDAALEAAAPLRDAQRIAERIARDETLADEARERYRSNGLPELEPSALLGLLDPGERLHAVHRMAMLEVGWRGATGADPDLPHGGTLYVTSQRLVRMRDGSDLAIEVDQPRLLRVQLAAALAAARAGVAGS